MGRASLARRARKIGAGNKYKKPYVWGGGLDLDFSVEEWDELHRFRDAVNSTGGEQLSLEKICKQAIFMTIQRAYNEAHKLSKVDGRESSTTHDGVSNEQSTSSGAEATINSGESPQEETSNVITPSRIASGDNPPALVSTDPSTDLLAKPADSGDPVTVG